MSMPNVPPIPQWCPDCQTFHPPKAQVVFFKALASPSQAAIAAALASKRTLLRGDPLTAKKAQRKRAKGKVPICLACGDLCDRDDWLDYVMCLTCGRAVDANNVDWVNVDKLLGYQRVKRSLRQRAARRVAKWIKEQLG